MRQEQVEHRRGAAWWITVLTVTLTLWHALLSTADAHAVGLTPHGAPTPFTITAGLTLEPGTTLGDAPRAEHPSPIQHRHRQSSYALTCPGSTVKTPSPTALPIAADTVTPLTPALGTTSIRYAAPAISQSGRSTILRC